MVRYFFDFDNLEGDIYKGEISRDDYIGNPLQLSGRAVLVRDLSDNIFQPVQVTSCDISLIATKETPLEDIWNEDDQYWTFSLYKNNRKVFQGYVSSEAMEQPYNMDVWELNFEALGYLHYLKDTGYYNAQGLPYTGIDSVLGILANCFNRCFVENVSTFGILTAASFTVGANPALERMYLNQDVFYDNDGEAQDCFSVVEEILKSLGMVVFQYSLNFFVMSVNSFSKLLTEPINYRSYTSNGIFQAVLNLQPDAINQRIGTESKGAKTFFVNSNTSFFNIKKYNTFKVRHDFEYAPNLLKNESFENDGTNIDGWTLLNGARLGINEIIIDNYFGSPPANLQSAQSNPVDLMDQDTLNLKIRLRSPSTTATRYTRRIRIQLELTGGGQTFRLAHGNLISNVAWVQSGDARYGVDEVWMEDVDDLIYEMKSAPLPISGQLTVTFIQSFSAINPDRISLTEFNLTAENQNLEAEEFIISRTDTNTGSVPDVYEVRFNTAGRNILSNTFLDLQGATLDAVVVNGVQKSTAAYLCEQNMTFFSQTNKVFSCDLKDNEGLTPKRIDNIGSPFLITSEQKDLGVNISSVSMQQVGSILPPVSLTVERVFKETIKPTIKG